MLEAVSMSIRAEAFLKQGQATYTGDPTV